MREQKVQEVNYIAMLNRSGGNEVPGAFKACMGTSIPCSKKCRR